MITRLVMAKASRWSHASMFFAVVMLVGATLNGAPAPLSTTIPVGDGPVAIAIDQRARIVFVVNVRGNSVSLIDARTRQLMRTIKVGQLPHDVAINGRTGVAYVTDWLSDTISVIEPGATVARAIPVSGYRPGPL